MKIDCDFIVNKFPCPRYDIAETIFELRKCKHSGDTKDDVILKLLCKIKVNSDKKIIDKIIVKK